MATSRNHERIQVATRAAAERLTRSLSTNSVERAPAPGDLYVFGGGGDIGLEWLLVRFHPDDPGLALVAPVDDFPLAGTPDLVLDAATFGRTLVVRCGETDWLPARSCTSRLRVGTLTEPAVRAVRGRLADLARGRPLGSGDPSVDFDPEYEEWIDEVGRARHSVGARAERVGGGLGEGIPLSRFRAEPPPELVPDFEYSLAAESGGSLLCELGEDLAEGDQVFYLEVPDVPGGKLVLTADERGLQPVWHGPREGAPVVVGQDAVGRDVTLEWVSGPQERLHRTSTALEWIDGRVVLRVGSDPARVIVAEL